MINYNKFLKTLTQEGLNTHGNIVCNCNQVSPENKVNVHILTENIELIRSDNLRKVVNNGCKFRIDNEDDTNTFEQFITETLGNSTLLHLQIKLQVITVLNINIAIN